MSQTASQTLSPTDAARPNPGANPDVEHVDVLIVGAGISGVGAAYHLQQQCPERSFVVLEALESFGGTWLMHKYPGIRSDSDLYTFGYRFKPWTGAPIATAEEIRKYMGEVIEENDLAKHIRYHHRISDATWSSEDRGGRSRPSTRRRGTGTASAATSSGCARATTATPRATRRSGRGWSNTGPHRAPPTWPDDLDLTGKRVLVIGSGATTATIVPAIANDVEHVTVLQRSPTYFHPGRNINEVADMLRELKIDESWIHEIVRRKILHDQATFTQVARDYPDMAKEELLKVVKDLLPEGYDMKHFTPRYRPWQQRLAFVPEGDLFAGIRAGKATMVTDEIETFNETGVRTKGGEQLDADVIITATGFNMSVLGDIDFRIDGAPLNLADTVTYRGMMFTGVPNLLWVFGYFRRAGRCGPTCCRTSRAACCTTWTSSAPRSSPPQLRPEDEQDERLSWIDPDNFNPNYLMRAIDILPKRLDKPQWQHTQDYWAEKDALPVADLDDGCLRYS